MDLVHLINAVGAVVFMVLFFREVFQHNRTRATLRNLKEVHDDLFRQYLFSTGKEQGEGE